MCTCEYGRPLNAWGTNRCRTFPPEISQSRLELACYARMRRGAPITLTHPGLSFPLSGSSSLQNTAQHSVSIVKYAQSQVNSRNLPAASLARTRSASVAAARGHCRWRSWSVGSGRVCRRQPRPRRSTPLQHPARPRKRRDPENHSKHHPDHRAAAMASRTIVR